MDFVVFEKYSEYRIYIQVYIIISTMKSKVSSLKRLTYYMDCQFRWAAP